MRIRSLILFVLMSLVGVLTSNAQQTTNNVVVSFNTLGINPATVYSVTIQGVNGFISGNTVFANYPISISRAQQPGMTNGVVIFSNTVIGVVPYNIYFNGYSTITNCFFVSTNSNAPDASNNVYLKASNYGYVSTYQGVPRFVYTSSIVTNVSSGGSGGSPLAAGYGTLLATNGGTNVVSVDSSVVLTNGTANLADGHGFFMGKDLAGIFEIDVTGSGDTIEAYPFQNSIQLFSPYFSGNGSNLTALQWANVQGAPAGLVTNNATGVNLFGRFTGNGSGLTNLAAGNITNAPWLTSVPPTYALLTDATNAAQLAAQQATNGIIPFSPSSTVSNAQYAVVSGSASNLLGTISAGQVTGGIFTNNFISFITTNAAIDTNNVYVAGAGTIAANGHYVRVGAFAVSGQLFTNLSGVGYLCEDHTGLDGVQTFPRVPFYLGSTTNNCTDASSSMPMWYFSPFALAVSSGSTAPNFWTNSYADQADYPGAVTTGASPCPTVLWGTNITYITNSYNVGLLSIRTNSLAIKVNGKTGSDVLALSYDYPFKTCKAAKNFATNGCLIEVEAGNYYENDLLKNGVNWKFKSGVIGYDDFIGSTSGGHGIFDDYAGAITSNITGDILHWSSSASYGWNAILITNPTSYVKTSFNVGDASINTEYISDYGYSLKNLPTNQTFPNAAVASGYLASVVNCSYSQFDFGLIEATISDFSVSNPNEYDFSSANPFGALKTYHNSPIGFYWVQGEEHISFDEGYFNRPGVVNEYMIWVDANTNVTSDTSFFVNANRATGYFYGDGGSTTAASWINIKQWQGIGAAAQIYGSSKYYFSGEKVYNQSAFFPLFIFGGGSLNGSKNWLNFQKLSGGSSWLYFSSGNYATVNANILQFEDLSNTITSGIFFGSQSSNSTLNLSGLTAVTAGNVVTVSGGNINISGLAMTSTATNAIKVTGGNLTLNSDVVTAPANQFCITNTVGTNVYVLGGSLNSASGNTNLVGLFTVNGNIISTGASNSMSGSLTVGGTISGTFTGNGSGLTNLNSTNIVFSLTQTNIVSGQYYTNTTHCVYYADEVLTLAASVGVTGFQVLYDPAGGHNWKTNCDGTSSTTALSIAGMVSRNRLVAPCAAGSVVCFTNLSTVGTAILSNGYIDK